LNLWFLNINRSMSEWICPKRQKKRRLVYVMTTYLRQHGLMSFISLNIPEREINLHFVNSARLQQNAPFCILLKKIPFFHGFIILYLKFWLHRLYIQNATECTILHPSEKNIFWRGQTTPLLLLVSRGLACMHKTFFIK
jgi:nicotinic acid phosphoribosyltransferase